MNQIISYTLFILKRNRSILIFTSIFIAVVQFTMIQFMSNIDMEPMKMMLNSFPPAIKSIIGNDLLNKLSIEGSAAFAFTHPITFGMFSYLSISIPMKELTRSIQNGEMEMMLSYPITRTKVLSSVWLSGITSLLIICISGVAFTILALNIYHHTGSDVAWRMIQIGINLFALFLFVFAFSMVIAVYAKDFYKATTMAVAITGVSYLVMVLAQIWNKIEWTKSINFFNYFDPHSIINQSGNYLWQVFDLILLSIIMYFISLRVFKQKDV